MGADAKDARASLVRCHFENGEMFDRFYEILLEASDEIAPYFKDTDFTKQREALRNGVLMAVMYAEGDRMGKAGIDWIRQTHSRDALDVKPALYPVWLQTFLQTIEEFDPDFDAGVEAVWRSVLQRTIDRMVDGYGHRD